MLLTINVNLYKKNYERDIKSTQVPWINKFSKANF